MKIHEIALNITSKLNIPSVFLVFSLFAVSLFNEYLCCAASAFLCVYLFVLIHRNKKLVFIRSAASITILIISFLYLISVFWAIDKGMAFLGFLKILPLPLFMLTVMQRKGKPEEYLNVLPAASVVMTVVSGIVMIFSPRNDFFAPAGRLAGFFQYSNTFALILLVSLIITVLKERIRLMDYFFIPVLIVGIILSGSRTVFVLTVISVVVLMFIAKDKKARLFLGVISVLAVAGAIVYTALSGSYESIGRFLSTSFSESTFIGRILYYSDALPTVLNNPFGIGYLGYYYIQQSIQTGLYSVRYIHNDFLQTALDIGWLPAVMLIFCVIRSLFGKSASNGKRLILAVMAAHCFFDIDLQFTAVYIVFALLLDFDKGKKYCISSCGLFKGSLCGALGISVYMLGSLFAAILGAYSIACALYPWNTDVNTVMLISEKDSYEMDKRADAIISQNKYVTVAYSAKADFAYLNGDFGTMMNYKDLAIKNAPLMGEEYQDYIVKLLVGKELYIQAGDLESADICDKKIKSVLRRFNSIGSMTSDIGKRIIDQPVTELREELKTILRESGYID